jgi:hypothetical protein
MKRPFQIIVIAFLFILGGVATLIVPLLKNPLNRWTLPLALLGIIAIVGGNLVYNGCGWARWVVLAWLAFHVAVSVLNSLLLAAAHLVLLVAVAYFLFVPPTSRFFDSAKSQ